MPSNAPAHWSSQTWFRVLSAVYFAATGLLFVLLDTVIAPSFWYVPCAWFLVLGAALWMRPQRAASFFLPLTVVLVVELIASQLSVAGDNKEVLLITLALIAGCSALLAIALTASRTVERNWLAISLVLIALAFATDRAFTRRLTEKTITAQWSADPRLPWGDDATKGPNGELPVTIYQQTAGGFCYDSIYSDELKARLVASGQPTTSVTYNLFSDFGRRSGYNIASVAGLIFNQGSRAVRHDPQDGGLILMEENSPANTNKCHE